MGGNAAEVAVGRKHNQLMAHAELGQQSVDGSHLHAGAPANVPELGRADVIVAIRHQERHCGKSI